MRCSIRDVLWLTVVVAMGIGWSLDHVKSRIDWREVGIREAYIHEQVQAERRRADKERLRADSATMLRDILLRSSEDQLKQNAEKASPEEN